MRKSVQKHFLTALVILTSINCYSQEMMDLSKFSMLPNTKSLKLYGKIKSEKEFTCTNDDSTLFPNKTCANERFYEFDALQRVTSIIFPDKDSMAYSYFNGTVEGARYDSKRNQSSRHIYTLNKSGLIDSEIIFNSGHQKKTINNYDTRSRLIKSTEYSYENKMVSILKIEYDEFDNPTKITVADSKGQIFSEFASTYNKKKLEQLTALLGNNKTYYSFTYDDKENIKKKDIYNANKLLIGMTSEKYDKFGNVIETIATYKSSTGGETSISSKTTYTYDRFNNWIKMVMKSNISLTVKYRTIEYY